MPDAVELVKTIKKAATEAVEATKPVNVYFGQVQGITPLKINVEQKLILSEKQLILSRNVTDYTTYITVDFDLETDSVSSTHTHTYNGTTESASDEDEHTHDYSGTTDSAASSHAHSVSVSGKQEVTVHNALEVGDQVILIRQQEGQKYIVVDRIGGG